MMQLSQLSKPELEARIRQLKAAYAAFQARGLKLDMSRGKPSAQQLDLSLPLLHTTDDHDFRAENGMDVRNYGDFKGIPEARRLFGGILGVDPSLVIVGGSSSLNLLYDAISRAMLQGPLPGDIPWCKLPQVKFICPVPGYDWHFHMCDNFGIEMLPVGMDGSGPLMDEVEALAASDPAIKGMMCVPMYSNPSGITYADQTVRRLAAMPAAAKDFRIFWDNAYCLHHLYEHDRDRLLNLYEACLAAGHPDRPLLFASTSKVTFAGSGISAMAGSRDNMLRQASLMMYQMVCYDKLNQLRHTRFLPDLQAVEAHMARHAAILRPKFAAVLEALETRIRPLGIARWQAPKGGYFISFYAAPGTAKRIVQLCAAGGVTLTPAGAPYPHGADPADSLIRIAPTYPPVEELRQVMELFCIAVELAAAERLLTDQTR